MKGAIPIPYVVAIIFAVLVIVLIGYWFFITSNAGTGTSVDAQCNTGIAAFCQESYLRGWVVPLSRWPKGCGTEPTTPAQICGACKQTVGYTGACP